MSSDGNISKQVMHDKVESQIKTAEAKLETLKAQAETAKANVDQSDWSAATRNKGDSAKAARAEEVGR